MPLLALAAALNLTACSDDEGTPAPPICPPATAFWEQPHPVFLGLQGEVESLAETLWADVDGEEEEGTTTLTRFNNAGKITYYNPTGIEENRWIGMDMYSHAYLYDEQNRLQQARLTAVGTEPISYTLTYDEDNRYVPLPFELGPLDFFLVKGVAGITAEGTDFICTRTATAVTYITQTPGLRGTTETHTVYEYGPGESYPRTRKVWEMHDGKEVMVEQTTYRFADNGRLTERRIINFEDNQPTVGEEQTFHATLPLCLELTSVTDLDQTLIRYYYTYEEHGWISRIAKVQNAEVETETYTYTTVDGTGNWTEGRFIWSSRVNLAHWDGAFRVTRKLTYRPAER